MDGRIASGMGRVIDWRELLLDLRRNGWGLSKVAKALNLPRTTVNAWMFNAEPGYSNGVLLVALYLHVVHGEPSDVRFAIRVDVKPSPPNRLAA